MICRWEGRNDGRDEEEEVGVQRGLLKTGG